jgi:glycosyltransferase involved in cell wall biosynthesis
MRTICMLSDSHEAFDDRIYWKESVSLSHLGYKVTHVCVGSIAEHFTTKEHISIVQIARNPFTRNRYMNFLIRKLPYHSVQSRVYREAVKLKAEVYHTHGLWLLGILKKLKQLPWKPVVIHCIRESYGDMIRDYTKTGFFITIYKKLYAGYIERWQVKKIGVADHIITIDDAAYKEFSGHYGSKVSLIYNFSSIFPEVPPEHSIKKFDLIYTGGMTQQRGIMNIIEAAGVAKRKFPDITLLLLGKFYDPKFKTEIEQRIEELDLKHNVSIVDFVPHSEVKQYLAQSRIGLVTLLPIPKFHKNVPIKQFEYMAFGLPVIGSKLPPIENFISPVNGGILVDPTKPDEIALAIEKLLNDKEFYERLSANASKAAKESYNWKSEENKLKTIYRDFTRTN